MIEKTISLSIQKPFANLFRKRHVMIVLINENGDLVLGTKKTYPEGISRFLGGGVDADEDFDQAAKRELREEAGIQNIELSKLMLIKIIANTDTDTYELETAVYLAKIYSSEIFAGDDTDKFVIINPKDMGQLVSKYKNLDGVFTSGDYSHNWSDYGKVYGQFHQIVLEELYEQKYL